MKTTYMASMGTKPVEGDAVFIPIEPMTATFSLAGVPWTVTDSNPRHLATLITSVAQLLEQKQPIQCFPMGESQDTTMQDDQHGQAELVFEADPAYSCQPSTAAHRPAAWAFDDSTLAGKQNQNDSTVGCHLDPITPGEEFQAQGKQLCHAEVQTLVCIPPVAHPLTATHRDDGAVAAACSNEMLQLQKQQHLALHGGPPEILIGGRAHERSANPWPDTDDEYDDARSLSLCWEQGLGEEDTDPSELPRPPEQHEQPRPPEQHEAATQHPAGQCNQTYGEMTVEELVNQRELVIDDIVELQDKLPQQPTLMPELKAAEQKLVDIMSAIEDACDESQQVSASS